jgi:RNA polymerase sigma-70 factor (ECF subfamily)
LRAQQGDPQAFTWLTERYSHRIRCLLERRFSTNSWDADDILQETWARAFHALHRFQSRYRFSTWLFTIALRVACDLQRYHRRRPYALIAGTSLSSVPDRKSADCTRHDPDGESWWELARRVLSQDQATALWLRYAEDLPIQEIAAAMGKTSIGVRVILHRARALLLQHRNSLSPPDGVVSLRRKST